MQIGHNMNEENRQKIEEYIENHPTSKINKSHTVFLQGKNEDLQVYRLPIDMLFYNISNGRFKAEYFELKKKEGRELDSSNTHDAKKIKNLLINLDLKQSQILREDLKKYGQREPGIISFDGNVINGNRRMAILQSLVDEGETDLGYLQVARLPNHVSAVDLWKIEAGIQLSKSVQLDYGPINTLLKFKEGIDAGLSAAEIAKSLYGGFTESVILEFLQQLKLISLYLTFIGEQENFKKADGISEHFIDLRVILNKAEREGYSPDDIVAIQKIGFQLIHDGVPQRELRKIKDILKHEKITNEFYSALDYAKPEQTGLKATKLRQAESQRKYTEARTVFSNCLDGVKAADESEEPEKLLKRALTNLENIDVSNPSLKNPEIKKMIESISTIIKELENHSAD